MDKEYREKNKEHVKSYLREWHSKHGRAYMLKRKYGLTLDSFNSMLSGQGNTCASCGETDWGKLGPVVDHDHNTGDIRGIVCNRCNVALGMLKDNPEIARKLAIYLEGK